MNMCYKVFHIPGHGTTFKERSILASSIDLHLSKDFDRLDTETIKVSNQEEFESAYQKNNLLKFNRRLQFGKTGIWASNLLAYVNFLKTDYDYLMLVEDDISYSKDFTEKFIEYFNELPDDWELFSYFVPPDQYSRFQARLGTGNVVKAYQDWSNLCYIINKKTVEKILKDISANGISLPLDWYIYKQPNFIKSYTLSPKAYKPCSLSGLESIYKLKDEMITLGGSM